MDDTAAVRLIYHDVVTFASRDSVGFPGPQAAMYKLTPDRFERHLDALATITAAHPSRFGTRLTFDDGGASALWVATALERYGWKGSFFIVTSRIGTKGFLEAGAVQELATRGHVVGSHTETHPTYLARLDDAVIAREWRRSRDTLETLLGAAPEAAAVPGGSVSAAVVREASRAGFKRLYTSTPRIRPAQVDGMTVLGRFSIWADDPPALAAAIAARRVTVLARRRVSWEAKTAAKRVSPRRYEAVRSVVARRRSASARNDINRSV
jgi:peptidoglycan/xylan/chitin deacetylase (PgdA/CDA1 family)